MRTIDATGCVMGRLSSHVAKSLLNGDEVHVVNAEKVLISGSKSSITREYVEKRTLNHPRKGPRYPRAPHMMLKRAVRGMIPYQKPSGRLAFKRLKVDVGIPSNTEKKMETIVTAKAKIHVNYMTLGEISKLLGAKING